MYGQSIDISVKQQTYVTHRLMMLENYHNISTRISSLQ